MRHISPSRATDATARITRPDVDGDHAARRYQRLGKGEDQHYRPGDSPGLRSSKKNQQTFTYEPEIINGDLATEWGGSHATKVEDFTRKTLKTFLILLAILGRRARDSP